MNVTGDLRIGGDLFFTGGATLNAERLNLDATGVLLVDGAPEAGVPPGGEVSLGKVVRDHLRVRRAMEAEVTALKEELRAVRVALLAIEESVRTLWYAPGMPGYIGASEQWGGAVAASAGRGPPAVAKAAPGRRKKRPRRRRVKRV